MNIAFCLWLFGRSRISGDRVDLIVHEPFHAFGEGTWRQDLAAAVHRGMVWMILRAAERVWYTIPDWARRLRPWAPPELPFVWLPVPSNVPVVDEPETVTATAATYRGGADILLGHFGTYARHIVELLEPALAGLLANEKISILLLGKGSESFLGGFLTRHPQWSGRIHAGGTLPLDRLSIHLGACDVMLQPYLDGINTRHGSAMACLAHGLPIVTTYGRITEALWHDSGAVELVAEEDREALITAVQSLCQDPKRRQLLGARARDLYRDRFDIHHTVAKLRAGCASQ